MKVDEDKNIIKSCLKSFLKSYQKTLKVIKSYEKCKKFHEE